MAVLAVIGYWRTSKPQNGQKIILAGLYLVVILVLSKSLGALVITVLLLPLALLATVRLQLLAAAIVGGLAGGLFSSQIVGTVASIWSNYVVPAYFELMLSGIPLCA